MRRTLMIAAMAGLAAAGLAGCERLGLSTSSDDPGAPPPREPLPVPMVEPPIPDVPVPVGFKLDNADSRNYGFEGARIIDHVYTGHEDKFLLKRFYEHYMASSYRWTQKMDRSPEGGVIQLDFQKGAEDCTVTITEGGFLQPIKVSIFVRPNRPLQIQGGE